MNIEIKDGVWFLNGKALEIPKDVHFHPIGLMAGIDPTGGGIIPLAVNKDGKLELSAGITLSGSDIKIGAVEIQDEASDIRLDVVSEGNTIGADHSRGILVLGKDTDGKTRLFKLSSAGNILADVDIKTNSVGLAKESGGNLDSIKTNTDKLNVNLSTIAAETTLSGIKSQTDLLVIDPSGNLKVFDAGALAQETKIKNISGIVINPGTEETLQNILSALGGSLDPTSAIFSQNLADASADFTTSINHKFRIKAVLLHASAQITQTFKVTLVSANDGFNTLLGKRDLVNEQDAVYFPEKVEWNLMSGDEIKIECTNNGSPSVTVYFSVRYELV